MHTAKLIKSIVAATLLASGGAFAAPVEILINGGFEATTLANGTWGTYGGLAGWTTTDNIEVRNNVDGVAAGGHNFVELDTDHNSNMSQAVHTVANQAYTLSFQFQDRVNVNALSQGLNVSWGGATVDNLTTSQAGGGWETRTYTLIGDGSVKTLTFSAAGLSDSLGTSLDNVSLTAAVPEPETYGMMIAGLGLMGFIARRRKAAK